MERVLKNSSHKRLSENELQQEFMLIQAAQRGDEEALTQLYNTYSRAIFGYILHRVESVHIAQDLTSEVFVRVLEGLHIYRNKHVPFLAWLYQIAHSRLVDFYRLEDRRGTGQDIETTTVLHEDDVDDELMAAFRTAKISAAITKLTAQQQNVVLFRYIEGYDIQQTADAIGITIGAVKMCQRRALEILKQEILRVVPDENEIIS